MTYLDLVQRLARSIGITEPSTVSGQSDMAGRLVTWVADADELIQEEYSDWDFLQDEATITTVASTREYSLADIGVGVGDSDILASWDRETFIRDPSLSSHQKLTQIDYKEWLLGKKLGAVPTGTPSHFVIKKDGSVVLYPTPDAVHTVTADYYKRPSRLSDDGDISVIPAHLHKVIVYRAKMFFAEYEQDTMLYQSASADFNGAFDSLKAHSLPGLDTMSRASGVEMTVTPE